jgi:hypothetical protein
VLSNGGFHSMTRSLRRARLPAACRRGDAGAAVSAVSAVSGVGAICRKLRPVPSGRHVALRGSSSRAARVAESGSIPVFNGLSLNVASTLPFASQICSFEPKLDTGTM